VALRPTLIPGRIVAPGPMKAPSSIWQNEPTRPLAQRSRKRRAGRRAPPGHEL